MKCKKHDSLCWLNDCEKGECKLDSVVPLDVLGKWPTGTWLQQRRAMIKLDEARQALWECEYGGDYYNGNERT